MPNEGPDNDLTFAADPAQFRALMAEIKEFEPSLARALRKNLRKMGGTVADQMKVEVRKAPPTGGKSRGRHQSRDQIAAGIGVAIATGKKRQGVFVTGTARRMAAGHKPMPRAYNKKQFRHPVFASSKKRVTRWVSQQGNPYFGRTIKKNEPGIEQSIQDALIEAISTVRGSG